MKKILLFLLFSLCGTMLCGFDIVRNGKSAVQIEVKGKLGFEAKRGLRHFYRDVRELTGADLSLPTKAVGKIEVIQDQRPADAGCEAEITFPAENVMRVRGSDTGLCRIFALMLEKYAGVVYVWPGVSGTHYPQRSTLSIPEKILRYEPFFHLERSMSNGERSFLETLGLKWNIDCQHMVPYYILPIGKYVSSHQWPDPEVFPVIKGKRLDMKKEHKKFLPTYQSDFQPCHTSEKSIAEAVGNIEAYLKEHPERKSVSLAPNDNAGYCECPSCTAWNQGRKNVPSRMFDRYQDRSRSYFHWCNRVAEEVGKKYPDLYFGTLAYREVHMAPDFKLNPKLVVYLCYDFGTLQYPDVRKRFDQWFGEWVKTGATLGIWEYGFGDSYYTLPRVCFRMQGEQFRKMAENHFRAMFVEGAESAGDGPKRYLYMKLAENPFSDVKSLLKNWYEAAVGKEAAPFLARYYQFWEDFWQKKASRTAFADSRSAVYHTMTPYGPYMNGLDKGDMAELRKLMTEMVKAADHSGTGSQKYRAKVMMKAFEYIECGVKANFSEELTSAGTIQDAKQALALLKALPDAVKAMERRKELGNELLKDPDLAWWTGLKKLHSRSMTSPAEKVLGLTAAYVSDPYVKEELKKIARNKSLPMVTRQIAHTIVKSDRENNLLQKNPATSKYIKGKHSVTLPVKYGEWPLRIPVKKGKYLARVRITLPKDTQPTAKTWLNLRLQGKNLHGKYCSAYVDTPKIYPKAGESYTIINQIELDDRAASLDYIVNLFFFPDGSKVILSDMAVIPVK